MRAGRRRGVPVGWEEIAARRLAQWASLDEEDRARLGEIADSLLTTIRWEAARSFAIDDDMRVTIATHAALPVLALGPDPYRRVTNVVVHPRAVVRRGTRTGPAGTVTDRPAPVSGEAYPRGEVVLSWPTVLSDSARPHSGRNVVIHEFAHQIDALDGTLDGAPPADAAWLVRWDAAAADLEQRLRDEPPPPPVRTYALTNRTELWAVCVETFSTTPVVLAERAPDVYACLRDWFHHDPAEPADTATS